MLLGGAQHVDAAHVRHLDVGDQQVDRLALEQVDRGAAVLGEQHLVALAAQHDRQQLPHRPLVVDDEDARRPRGRRPSGAARYRWLLMSSTSARAGQADRHGRAGARLRAAPESRRCSRSRCGGRSPGRGRCPSRSVPWNGWNSPSSSSAGMPMPSSCTVSTTPSDAGSSDAGEAQPAAVGHRAQAVGRQVPDDLLDLPLVGLVPELGRPARRRRSTWPSLHFGAVAQQQRRVVQRAAHVEARDREPLRPRVGEKRADRRVQPLRLAQHDVHQLLLLGAERQLLAQDLDRADIDASGLRISCAMPAAISPTAASRCCIARVALELLDAR